MITRLRMVAPQALRGMNEQKRQRLIVSVARDSQGKEYVLSRIYDPVWNLSTLVWPKNVPDGDKFLHFPEFKNSKLLRSMQEAFYARWRIGLEGHIAWTAKTVRGNFFFLSRFTQWLDARGVVSFSEVSSKIALEYAAWCRQRRHRGGRNLLKPETIGLHLYILEMLWSVRDLVDDALPEHPWPEESARSLAGISTAGGRSRKTDSIPSEVSEVLFKYAEALIARGDILLDGRDKALRIKTEHRGGKSKAVINKYINGYLTAHDLPQHLDLNKEITLLRTACYYTLGVTTGMRSHELASLRPGCFYVSEHNGEAYGWLKGRSDKTYAGECEWMVPVEIGKRSIELLERISEPLREKLDARIAEIELRLAGKDLRKRMRRTMDKELRDSRDHAQYLFLGNPRGHGKIRVLSYSTAIRLLRKFAQSTGTQRRLHPHQFRATFAEWVAGHILGDLRYLKTHYKHWSMDMTLLYAMNRRQDESLYQEVYDQFHEYNARIVDHWLDADTPVSGGAAERIKLFRRDEVKVFSDRREMVLSLSDQVIIRGTGTSWCMADLNGCGGLGIIEKSRCVYCCEGVIDDTHQAAWINIHRQQQELIQLNDIGPGGRQRVLRDLRAAEKVLSDLGVPFEPVVVSEENK